MNKNNNIIIKDIAGVLVLIIVTTGLIVSSNKLVWRSNVYKHINKTFTKTMTIRSDKEYSCKGKEYRIIFCSSKDAEDDLYLQCFEKKINGYFYKPTYGAGGGKSTSLYGMVKHYVHGTAPNDGFVVVYGYNTEFIASNFSVLSTIDNKWIAQDISIQKYFLYIYNNIEYPKIIFHDENNSDISPRFY